jgi:hypothetical protein
MQRVADLAATLVIGVLGRFAGAGTAKAQAPPNYALEYYGGPVLETFTIYPLYYGAWSAADMANQQNFLQNLVDYISGKNAPAGQQPMLRQYGVNSATLAVCAAAKPACMTASPGAAPTTLSSTDVTNIIHANQAAGNLPPYGPHTLIALFPAAGFTLGCAGCSYHGSESSSSFYAVVPHDTGPTLALVTAHEVFEAATDPGVDGEGGTAASPGCPTGAPVGGPAFVPGAGNWGWLTASYNVAGCPHWGEAIDQCGVSNFITLTNLGGIQIPSAVDNTLGVQIPPAPGQPLPGSCSTTGYSSTGSVEVHGVTLAAYLAKYATLRPSGWRLYILQTYISPTGEVLYNAVWRPAGKRTRWRTTESV